MQQGKYKFTPTLIPTLAAGILIPLCVSLGLWQLDRADEKRQLQEHLQNNLAKTPLSLETVVDDQPEYRFRRADVYGEFDSGHIYLLDNAIWQGRPGYLVLVPFRYAGGRSSILVNRGWIPMGATRGEIPHPITSDEPMQLQGTLSPPPGKLLELDASAKIDTTVNTWPQVIQQVDIDQMSLQIGYTIAPLILQIAPGHPAAFAQGWQAYVDRPQKHVSYAVQWFSFAAIMLLLYIVLNTRRNVTNRFEEKIP